MQLGPAGEIRVAVSAVARFQSRSRAAVYCRRHAYGRREWAAAAARRVPQCALRREWRDIPLVSPAWTVSPLLSPLLSLTARVGSLSRTPSQRCVSLVHQQMEVPPPSDSRSAHPAPAILPPHAALLARHARVHLLALPPQGPNRDQHDSPTVGPAARHDPDPLDAGLRLHE